LKQTVFVTTVINQGKKQTNTYNRMTCVEKKTYCPK